MADVIQLAGEKPDEGLPEEEPPEVAPTRTIWSGNLRIGLVNIPVKAVSITKDKRISFRMLHRRCKTPISYKRFCQEGDEVSLSDIVFGYPLGRNKYIVLEKKEIDGARCIASLMKGVVLQNRRLVNITYRYPEIERALAENASGYVLDGEIAVFLNDRPDFASLAERDHQSERLRIEYLSKALGTSYMVFDILYAKGESVMDRPLGERKRILRKVLQESEAVTIADSFPEKGEDYFHAALKMGIEGVMAKRLDSLYQPGVRSPDWIKIKKGIKLDQVVGGYIPGKGNREPYFGGLLMGAYSSDRLVYIGRVGSGFSEKEMQQIVSDLQTVSESPFSNPPPTKGAKWVKPNLVVQVAAMEVTEDGRLRAPVFLRLRDDKDPLECTLDQVM